MSAYKVYRYNGLFTLKNSKETLQGIVIAYETWGTLNEDKNNAILVHPPLTGSSHAKSHENNPQAGWWENFIGPDKALDTEKYFVICADNLGGCNGSSGPSSINPETEKPYAWSFPPFTAEDIVRSQFFLLDHLGIKKVYACVGGSLGGMCSLMAAVLFPNRVERIISISTAIKSYPCSVAWSHVQRQAIMSDPCWSNGNYYDQSFPNVGLNLARQIGTISYRGVTEFNSRFKPDTSLTCFRSIQSNRQVESYLTYQGAKFVDRFDPNSLLYLLKVVDDFSIENAIEESSQCCVKCPVLIIGVKSDILFPIWQQKELFHIFQNKGNHKVTFVELDAITGHDTFLIDNNRMSSEVKTFLYSTVSNENKVKHMHY